MNENNQNPTSELDSAILEAYAKPGDIERANKVYQILLRSFMYIPVEKQDAEQPLDPDEPFRPLIAKHGEDYFLLAFDSSARLQEWAGSSFKDINSVELTGRDLVHGLGPTVYLCLNPGTPFYKEFAPDEIKRLKVVVAKTQPRK